MWDFLFSLNYYQLVPIGISILSLIISLYGIYKTRKTLTITWRKDLEVVQEGEVFFFDEQGEFRPYGHGLLAKVEIVNPSPNDIAYFDLRAFSPSKNINTYILTRKSLISSSPDIVIYRGKGESELFKMEIPDKTSGVLKANSFTTLDLFILPNEHIDNELLVSFKVAIKSWLVRDQFAVTNRKIYRPNGVLFNIEGWKDMLEEEDVEN